MLYHVRFQIARIIGLGLHHDPDPQPTKAHTIPQPIPSPSGALSGEALFKTKTAPNMPELSGDPDPAGGKKHPLAEAHH